jgi:hypothetical protein
LAGEQHKFQFYIQYTQRLSLSIENFKVRKDVPSNSSSPSGDKESSSCHIMTLHRAAPGAFMMSLEQKITHQIES